MSRALARTAAVGLIAAAALSLTACGGSPHLPVALPDSGATLSGTVKYGTDDIHFALIMVQAADGSAAYSKIDDEGRFHAINVPVGEVRVAVNTAAGRGEYQTAVMQAGAMTGGGEGKTGRKKVNVKFIDVPKKYFDPTTTPFRTTVERGDNTFDIVIPK